MNTITQIENALIAINQASFQTLVNHLLHLEGVNRQQKVDTIY